MSLAESAAPPEPAETTAARILRVATELFAQKGFHGTGVQELSEATGLARGALYYHIKSKDQLLYEVLRAPHEQVVARARAVLSTDAPPERRLRELARGHLRSLVDMKSAWTVSSRDIDALPDEQRHELLTLQRQYQQLWREAFHACEAAGVVKPVDDVQFRGFLGMMSQAFNWIDVKGAMTPEQIADAYLELLLDGLRPRRA
jgi:TetR/AcrR family transcriptional regulator, cholesterol catabolism regulator